MNDIVKIIMDLKRKDENTKVVKCKYERCDECGCDNVWDIELIFFRHHLDEHRSCEKGSRKTP